MKSGEMTKGRYDAEAVRAYVSKIIERHGVPEVKAGIVSGVLIEADLRGIWSHGINNLDLLVLSAIDEGGVATDAVMEDVTRNSAYSIRHFDAHGDLGPCSAMVAVDSVKELAREHGFGKVYVFNANHFGAGAIYSEKICEDSDLAGRVTCTTPSVMIPYGGVKKRLGTNLISWSIPFGDSSVPFWDSSLAFGDSSVPNNKTYVTIDMATTVHSLSGVVKAVVEGSPLPFPVYNQEGGETSDSSEFSSPDDFLSRGAMIPLGGLKAQSGGERSDAGYKGSGLAVLIELDNVIGGGFSAYIEPTVHDQGRWIRQSFEAWRIDTRLPRDAALKEIARTVEDIKGHGGSSMLLPGEKELRHRGRSLKEGIAYQAVQVERLNALGKEVGLEKLQPVS